jgi:hypothetical protein
MQLRRARWLRFSGTSIVEKRQWLHYILVPPAWQGSKACRSWLAATAPPCTGPGHSHATLKVTETCTRTCTAQCTHTPHVGACHWGLTQHPPGGTTKRSTCHAMQTCIAARRQWYQHRCSTAPAAAAAAAAASSSSSQQQQQPAAAAAHGPAAHGNAHDVCPRGAGLCTPV